MAQRFVDFGDIRKVAPIPADGVWRLLTRCAECGAPFGMLEEQSRSRFIEPALEPVKTDHATHPSVTRCRACGNHTFVVQVGRCASRFVWWKPWTWWRSPVWTWRGDDVEATTRETT